MGHKKVVKIPKILAKISTEDAQNQPKAKKQDAKGRRSRQKAVGKKTKRKVKVRPRAKTWEEKRFFGWGPLFFSALVPMVVVAVVCGPILGFGLAFSTFIGGERPRPVAYHAADRIGSETVLQAPCWPCTRL
jgi:hypothetical protein